jgi:hypothetical protein
MPLAGFEPTIPASERPQSVINSLEIRRICKARGLLKKYFYVSYIFVCTEHPFVVIIQGTPSLKNYRLFSALK